MDDSKKGHSQRFNEKFLSKFVTNMSINLDKEPIVEKNQQKVSEENMKTKILNSSYLKKPNMLNEKSIKMKSNGALLDINDILVRSSQLSSGDPLVNSMRSEKVKIKSYSQMENKKIKEDVSFKQIIVSNSKLTFHSPEIKTKKSKFVKKEFNNLKINTIKPHVNNLNNDKISFLKNNLKVNNNSSNNKIENKIKNVINLKKKISEIVSENGKKSINKEVNFKKPSLLSSPVSPKNKISNNIYKISFKSPIKEKQKFILKTKKSKSNNFVKTNGKILLTDSNINKSNAEETETNSRLNTLQFEISKTPSGKIIDENGFIKNKYKNLLETFKKSKQSTVN